LATFVAHLSDRQERRLPAIPAGLKGLTARSKKFGSTGGVVGFLAGLPYSGVGRKQGHMLLNFNKYRAPSNQCHPN
jgi:hypothetical protein